MGKAEKQKLNEALSTHLTTIHETLEILDQTAPSCLDKVSWNEVVKMGEQVSKQATIVGMLWTGEKPEAKGIEESMTTYFNTLQGFLLVSHGSTVGAGPTLSSSIRASVKEVVDSSFKLMMETVSSYGSRNKDLKIEVPKLVGAIWEVCSALKKTPTSNIAAIGRAMTQVAVSVKDVLREMNELKPESDSTDDAFSEAESKQPDDDNSLIDDELGNDLSPEEMKIAYLAIQVVSDTVLFIKELIRTISVLIKHEKPEDCSGFVNSLEKLLKLCQEIGAQIDELGASLYPPQEVPAIKAALEKISNVMGEMQVEVNCLKASSEAFQKACNDLKSSMKQMESELDRSDMEVKMQNVVVSS